MKVPNSLSRGHVGFKMTPMIDVVFLLIIFFLVSSHLARQEAQLELPLPTATTGETPTDDTAPRVTVNVLADGTLMLSGRKINADELQRALSAKLSEAGRDLEVRVRTDRRVVYGNIEPLMLACIRAGVWNVTLAVYRPEDVR